MRRAGTRPERGEGRRARRFRDHRVPEASAGATLWVNRFRGKLNGPIATTTPTGSRTVNKRRFSFPGRVGRRRPRGTSPRSGGGSSSAANSNTRPARSTSTRASAIGLPTSRRDGPRHRLPVAPQPRGQVVEDPGPAVARWCSPGLRAASAESTAAFASSASCRRRPRRTGFRGDGSSTGNSGPRGGGRDAFPDPQVGAAAVGIPSSLIGLGASRRVAVAPCSAIPSGPDRSGRCRCSS